MAGFTLIHGSTQNSSGWARVIGPLRDFGHQVAAPDLPKQNTDWKLTDYADYIAGQMPSGTPKIVVAHSFSGVFLPLIREADVLIFEAAVVPQPGRSVREQLASDPTMLAPEWLAAGRRWSDPEQHAQLAKSFLFHDCPEETARWAISTIELFDTSPFLDEVSPGAWPRARAVSIVCTMDRTLTPDWSRRAATRIGAEIIEINAGHSPHVCQPDLIAQMFHRTAASS